MNINRPASYSPTVDYPPQAGESSKKPLAAKVGPASEYHAASTGAPPMSRTGDSPARAHRPRSLSETRMITQLAQLATEPDEPVMSMKQLDQTLDNFQDFFVSHTLSLHEELNDVKGTIGHLSTSLAATQEKKATLEKAISQRKEGAKTRAISRENTIKDLKADNTNLTGYIQQSDNLLSHLQAAVDTMEHQLGNLNSELDRKSKIISSQCNAIKNIKDGSKEVKRDHLQELENKDREILAVKQRLDSMKDAMKAQRDEAETLKKLNTTLLAGKVNLMAQSQQNKDVIADLKEKLMKVARLAGIEL